MGVRGKDVICGDLERVTERGEAEYVILREIAMFRTLI